MEIQKPDTVRTNDARTSGLRADITRQNRESIEAVSNTQPTVHGDRVDLSSTTVRLLLGEDAQSSEREERVAALREAAQAGTLNTPERVERAAQELLSGE